MIGFSIGFASKPPSAWGKVVVIDHVPADVCSICGDVLFKPETTRAIERLLSDVRQPDASVRLYEYA